MEYCSPMNISREGKNIVVSFIFFFLPLSIFSIFWSKICDNNVNASNINGNVITYNYVDWMDIDRCFKNLKEILLS